MTKLINNWTIGADIELFLQDRKTKEIVSAEGLVKGTKYNPFIFDESNPFFAVSLDNVLAEFCIPPTDRPDLFLEYINKSRNYIESTIPKKLCTVAHPAATLRKKWLMTENAQTFGCDPDLNVWLRQQNETPMPVGNMRTAGGHIHIGYDGANDQTEEGLILMESIIKAMDLFVGVPSVLKEPENDRKKMYGKAGAFRTKSYGVEYRSISNYYLQSEELTEWVFGASIKAIGFVNDDRMDEIDSVEEFIQSAINNNDKVQAQRLINQFEL